jgi:hypothetical protein
VSGALGLALGFGLFRFWLALLVAFCLIGAALSFYGGQVLHEPLNEYLSQGYDAQNELVTLLEPEEALPAQPNWREELSGIWAYLGERVPQFQTSFVAIVLTTGLAGLLFGLLLPKTARAVWAATAGLGLFLPAVYVLLRQYAPSAAGWLEHGGLIVAALLWSGSLVYNLADMHEKRPKRQGEARGRPAEA